MVVTKFRYFKTLKNENLQSSASPKLRKIMHADEIVKGLKEMSEQSKKLEDIKRPRSLRNIGVVTAEKLYSIGINAPGQIIKSNPERLYEKLKTKHGGKLDPCVLHQIRGAKLDEPWWKCKGYSSKMVRSLR
jgi:hypothetical protein